MSLGNTHSGYRRAVTLLEVLVTVAVSVLLTLIVIVSIRGVRGQTLAMRELHNLRLSGQDLLLWSADNDDKILNIESPDSPLFHAAYPHITPDLNLFVSLYFSQFVNWPHLLEAHSRVKQKHWQTAYTPDTIDGPDGIPAHLLERQHLQLSTTLHTAPELWSAPTPTTSNAECAAYMKTVRFSNIRYPGSKGFLANLDIPGEPSFGHVLFADSSAQRLLQSDLLPPTNNPRSPTRSPGRPVIHTLHGYHGRDK